MVDAKKDESPTPDGGQPYQPDTRNLEQRLLAVMAEVGYIQKGGKTESGPRFTYVKHDDVMSAVRPALVKHGVFPYVSTERSAPPVDVGKTSNGNTVWMSNLTISVTFVNVDNPEDLRSVTYPGTGIDTGDKGEGKALSYALKYALLKTFLIESGDDADNESSHVEYQRNAPAPAAAPANGNPAAAKLRGFWASARQAQVPEESIHRYFKRNFGLESTKDASADQLADATMWAKMVGQAVKKLNAETTASGLADGEQLKKAGELFGVASLDEMTLKEWNALTAWVTGGGAKDPDDDIPF